MSQIWFEAKHNETPVKVMAGYDRPLSHYFCTIFLPEDADGEDQLLFSSLDDPGSLRGGYATPEEVMEKITLLGISVPRAEAWLDTIKKNEGNKRYRFSEDLQSYVV